MDRPPGTEERLAVATIEERLRRLRNRYNIHTAQNGLYSTGTVAGLSFSVITLLAFSLPRTWFSVMAWSILILCGFFCFRLIQRCTSFWTNPRSAARRIDRNAGLKGRLATLAGLINPESQNILPQSVLVRHLLNDNLEFFPSWEIKKIAPSYVPLSLLPFCAAIVLAAFVASIPLLSPASETLPFSLTNLELVASELPQRAGRLFDERIAPTAQGDQPPEMVPNEDQVGAGAVESNQTVDVGKELAELAALPEELQEALKKALAGLPDSEERLQSDMSITEESKRAWDDAGNFEQLSSNNGNNATESGPLESRNTRQNADSGDDTGSGTPPKVGGGLQKLRQARLERRKNIGVLQSGEPQRRSQGGRSGKAGLGAGKGTDKRLYGSITIPPGGPQRFSLSLDGSFEKSSAGQETIKDEGGGVFIKSASELNENQTSDDAMRNAQVPAEYEDIVKRLFSEEGMP